MRAWEEQRRREAQVDAIFDTSPYSRTSWGPSSATEAADGLQRQRGRDGVLTRKIGPEVQVERDDGSFLRQYTSVTHLVNAATEPVVAAAYFEGDIAGLNTTVDTRGKGTWDQWLGHLDANDFKGANKLLTS